MIDIFDCLYTAYTELPSPVRKDPKFEKLIQTLLECEDKLTHRLNDEDRQLFSSFVDATNNLSNWESFDAFRAGVRIGAQLHRTLSEED